MLRALTLTDTDTWDIYIRQNPLKTAYINVHKLRPYYGYKLVSSTSSVPGFITLVVHNYEGVDELSFRFDIDVGTKTGCVYLMSIDVDRSGTVYPKDDSD